MGYSRHVVCDTPGCGRTALFKVAAPWSAGRFAELKTYGLTCEGHSAEAYREALQRMRAHPFSPEEQVGEIALYHFRQGTQDREMPPAPTPV